jgi:hypothetical protein
MTATNWVVGGDIEGRPTSKECSHLGEVRDVSPKTPGECEDCIREGTQWVHLRLCLECGQVSCCDNSPMRHATKHWHATKHDLMRSVEPGEEWGWCYPDELVLVPGS